MSTFDSTKTELSTLLKEVVDGKLQLPDFQRGWVWDDEHIRSLLVSIARSFPIGAVMLLEAGGDTRFQVRPVEGVTPVSDARPERLILDGQQRLTSLTQVLRLQTPVLTKDDKKREIKRFYYFNIEKALQGPDALGEAIVGVDDRKQLRSDFGRKVDLDLSTSDMEFAAFHFPCNQILDGNDWMYGLMKANQDRVPAFMKFSQDVLEPFRRYLLPVIALKKETSKEAVCLVFEKVNTGGVPLSVFELVTATYAADGFNLRSDWYGDGSHDGRKHKLTSKPLLKGLEATDFLQGISLLYTYERRQADLAAGRVGKEAAAVSAKREHVLVTPLEAYRRFADPLTDGFLEAEQFLRHLGFYHPKYIPYAAQLVPLAAVLTKIGERWWEPQLQDKLTRWFWCGVFGELYGSATESRIANDLVELLRWMEPGASELPSTVVAAGFQASRLDTLRSRTSAAYRGLYVLLQRLGARDFYWKAPIVELDRNEKKIDIHHIFPRKWCEDRRISPKTYNAIVNKTAISLKANRKIGKQAPSVYLDQLENDPKVRLTSRAMNDILTTHAIDPLLLRSDDFDGFYTGRRAAMLKLVEDAMGKEAIHGGDRPQEDDDESEEVVD